jgi:hypothetical protein
MHTCSSKFSTIYGELEQRNYQVSFSIIGFLTPEYLGFQVIPRFTGTGTCISPVPVNRGILTSLFTLIDSHQLALTLNWLKY